MPTYEYNCDKCGVFEHRQSFNDAPLERCPTCGGQVRRLISRNVNIIYKTGGFYVSDHRSSDYRSKANKDGGSGSSTSSTSTSSTSTTTTSTSTGKAAE